MAILTNVPHKPPWPTPNFDTAAETGANLNIVIGNIPTPDQEARYQNVGAAALTWIDYRINSRYEQDRHIYMAGLTSPGGFTQPNFPPVTNAFFQLASPSTLWMVDWTASRLGAPPIIPSPIVVTALGGGGPLVNPWVFMDQIMEPSMIILEPGGVLPVYRISGTYVYGSRRPDPDLFRDVIFPIGPWVIPDNITKVIDQSLLKGGLIDGQQFVDGGG